MGMWNANQHFIISRGLTMNATTCWCFSRRTSRSGNSSFLVRILAQFASTTTTPSLTGRHGCGILLAFTIRCRGFSGGGDNGSIRFLSQIFERRRTDQHVIISRGCTLNSSACRRSSGTRRSFFGRFIARLSSTSAPLSRRFGLLVGFHWFTIGFHGGWFAIGIFRFEFSVGGTPHQQFAITRGRTLDTPTGGRSSSGTALTRLAIFFLSGIAASTTTTFADGGFGRLPSFDIDLGGNRSTLGRRLDLGRGYAHQQIGISRGGP
mmetsp:Transcript_31479/g.65727  ORF Transcript_31479/g.65727 Transcript_31479/m.65727 type:complete len:264 (-) Transcript_31479:1244-2035(-)